MTDTARTHCTASAKPAATAKLQSLIDTTPDLVDRIFDYILAEMPGMAASVQKHKAAVRAEFAGEKCYIANRPATKRQEQAAQVLALFNGRNTHEIARKLHISPVTVWRYIKQQGPVKPLQIFSK